MLSKEDNALLARIGPGTPCGELMRRYWHPIAPAIRLFAESERARARAVERVRERQRQLALVRERS